MIYRAALTQAMTDLAADPLVCFVGYGLTHGRAMGTLAGVKAEQLIETPVAENLMTGIATGLALAGRRPIVFFERFDFVLNAADQIVNHLDAIATMSRGEFSPACILRVVVGNRKKPLFTGETHTRCFAAAFRSMLRMPVVEVNDSLGVTNAYRFAHEAMKRGESTVLIERKDLL